MRRWPRVPRLRTLPRAGGSGWQRAHGDEFAWLGDAASQAVTAQLAAEKQYTQLHLQPLAGAEMELYGQMASSIPAESESVPEPWGSYDYYTHTPARRDLPRFCRRRRGSGGGGEEEVLLDLGALADRHGFASLGAFAVSPNHRMLAYTLDTSGAEAWTLWVVEIATGAVHARIEGAHGIEWVGDERLVYTAANRRGRPSAALLHAIGGAARAELLYEEEDEEWVLEVGTPATPQPPHPRLSRGGHPGC